MKRFERLIKKVTFVHPNKKCIILIDTALLSAITK